MKNVNRCAVLAAACLLASPAFAADGFSSTSIPQVSGYTSTGMSMADIMKPLEGLAASLPKGGADGANWSMVLQSGNYNRAAVVQSGTRNTGLVAQTGAGNMAVLQQFNGGQQAFIIQNGIGNVATTTQR